VPDRRQQYGRRRRVSAFTGLALVALLFACGPSDSPPAATRESNVVTPVELDLTGTDPEVAQLLGERLAQVNAEPRVGRHRGALGMACEVNGLARCAAENYEQAVRLEPEEPRWPYFLAQMQAQEGEMELALKTLQPVLAAAPAYTSAWLYQGQWQLDLGRADRARTAYERAIVLEPTNPAATLGLARVLLREARPEEAITLLLGLQDRTATGAYFNQLLGLAYRDAGQMDRAREYLAAGAPGQQPGWPDPWHDQKASYQAGFGAEMIRAETLMERGRLAEAIAIFESLREERSDDLALLNNLSVAYRRAGQEEQAFQVLSEGLRSHPDYYPFHLNISAAYQRRGDSARALEHLDRAVGISPNLADAHDRRGRLLLGLRRFREALDAFNRALENDADRPATLVTAAVLEAELKNWPQAVRRSEQALALDPNQVGALIVLGRARAELGEFAAAEQALDRAARVQPDHRTLAATRTRLEQLRSGAK